MSTQGQDTPKIDPTAVLVISTAIVVGGYLLFSFAVQFAHDAFLKPAQTPPSSMQQPAIGPRP